MLAFCGQEPLLIDANGRIKLSVRFVEDFLAHGNGEIVLYCLPEGAIALYPEEVYREMRKMEENTLRQAGNSMLLRRNFRRFGALSSSDRITRQGRITLPQSFRELTQLTPGTPAVLVGVEMGVELWNAERWQAELQKINQHEMDLGELELQNTLQQSSVPSK